CRSCAGNLIAVTTNGQGSHQMNGDVIDRTGSINNGRGVVNDGDDGTMDGVAHFTVTCNTAGTEWINSGIVITQTLGGVCNGETPINLEESSAIAINPPITHNGFPNGLKCGWKIKLPHNCDNSIHIVGYLRRGAKDAIRVMREGVDPVIIVPQDKQIDEKVSNLPEEIMVDFVSDGESQHRGGYWKGTIVAENCRRGKNVIEEVKDGIDRGVNEISNIIPGIEDIFHPKGLVSNYSDGETIGDRSHWFHMNRVKPGTNHSFKFRHPMKMYIATKNPDYFRSFFIVSENRVARENLFEAFGKSRVSSNGGVAMPVFTGRTEYTILNGNRYEDGSKSTFLYFVDERENNNEVYEVRGESLRMEVNHRRSITLLSPDAQIGMTQVRLAKHGGLKISAGGLREMWHPKYQLIRLTTYDTANISSYSIFDPIITIEPTNDENVSYTINNLLYLSQVSMEAGAQGIIMSAGYPDFKIDQRKIDFTMRMKDQVYLDMFVQANTTMGSFLTITSKSNHTQLSKIYTDMEVKESVRTDAAEFRVLFEPSNTDSDHSDFLFATFWTRNG
ncbi:hypothetical protein PRIPAC_74155, partial [Pristionchus pacificus]|uniref:CUB domain-containing protein n=1 Tax=Pristionchus pacificus TaxID=54126 RepID=A0A8R1Z3Q6_PRIPA